MRGSTSGVLGKWIAAAVLIVAFVFVLSAQAQAQAPGFSNVPEDLVPLGDQTGGTAGGQRQGGDTAVKGTPGEKQGRKRVKCKTRGRVRTCKTYRGRVLVKKCKKQGSGRNKCRKIRPGARGATAAGPRATISALSSHNFQTPPLPAVGRFYYGPRGGWCSGTMLLRGVVLTAAHCVHDAEKGGGYLDPRQFTFTPGNTWDGAQGVTNYGNWQVANFWVTNSYVQYLDKGLDWALVLLNPDANGNFAGDFTGTFPSYGNLQLTASNEIIAMGYPASGPWTNPQYQGGNGQYFCRETFDEVQTNSIAVWLKFNGGCPMNGGSSGGPNFVLLDDGNYGIVAVNNRGSNDPATGWGAIGYNIWFDQNYVDFVNNVLAIINGQARSASARSGPAAAVSVNALAARN